MKKILIPRLVTIMLLLIAFNAPLTVEASTQLTDINNSYAKDAINELVEKGIINGTGDGKFNPAGKISRQDFAIVLTKALGLDVSKKPASATFSDVPASHYSYAYVEAAVAAGLIAGVGEGQFGLNQNLTREAMAVLFVRALGADATGYADKLTFADAGSISSWAKDAVGYAVEASIMNGAGNNSFNPQGLAERQQVAIVASRFLPIAESYQREQQENQEQPDPSKDSPQYGGGNSGGGNYTPSNVSPVVSEMIDDYSTTGDSIVINLNDHFTDPDGNTLTFTTTSDSISVVTSSIDGNLLIVRPVNPLNKGTAQITVTADDGKGGSVTEIFNVSIISPITFLENLSESPNSTGAFKINGGTLYFSENAKHTHAGADISVGESLVDLLTLAISNHNIMVDVFYDSTNHILKITDNYDPAENDSISLNLNHFQDSNGIVLSGSLEVTYKNGIWVPRVIR